MFTEEEIKEAIADKLCANPIWHTPKDIATCLGRLKDDYGQPLFHVLGGATKLVPYLDKLEEEGRIRSKIFDGSVGKKYQCWPR